MARQNRPLLREQENPEGVVGDVLATAESLRLQGEDGAIIVEASCVLLVPNELLEVGSWRMCGPSESTPHVLYRLVHPDLPQPELRLIRARDNLPRQMTAFIGREQDITAIGERFYLSRLVSIVGPGGIGKTRVGVQVAYQLLERQRDGAWWVDGRRAATAEAMAESLLRILPDAREGEASSLERLQETLRARELLILLDNAESAIDAVSTLVQTVGQSCPNVAFLVTSRRPLKIEGESVYQLGTLTTVGDDSPAERLFLDRLSLHDPGFVPSGAQSRSIQRICQQLDGFPLAVELAAAQYPSRSIAQIEQEVSSSILDLKLRRRSSVATLNAVVGWGYDSLSNHDQAAFSAISIFPLTFDLEMATIASGSSDAEASLQHMIDASLIQSQDGVYRWLLPLRAFARQRLRERGEEPKVRQRVTDYCVQKVESLYQEGVPFGDWVAICDGLYDLVVEILDHRLRQPVRDDTSFRLVYGLYDYWYSQGRFTEGEAFARRLVAKSDDRPVMEKVRLYNASGVLRMQQGRHRDAASDLQMSLTMARKVDSSLLESKLLANYALALCRIPRFTAARESIAHACELSSDSEDTITHMRNLINRANIELAAGDCSSPWKLFPQIRALGPVGDDLDAVDLTESFLLTLSGNFRDAQGILEGQMPRFISKRDWRKTLIALNALVPTLVGQQLYRQAAVMTGLVSKLRERLTIWHPPFLVTAYTRAVEEAREALAADFDAEFALGREMSLEELGEFLSRRGTPVDARTDDIGER